MAYEIKVSDGDGKWHSAPPENELRALLDVHPDGVSFVNDFGQTVRWRKTPRDTELVDAIRLSVSNQPDATAAANAVYDLLESRGVL